MHRLLSIALLLLSTTAFADGPADNIATNVRRLPKLGIEVPAAKRTELEAGLTKLKSSIDELVAKSAKDATVRRYLPDVQIFYKAVHDALKYQEFMDVKELDEATKQLALGQERAEQLLKGTAPWTTACGLVVRGYVSKIDGSVQPYGMVVPEAYTPQSAVGYRCDVWLHGRGETMTELNFIRDRMTNVGTFAPPRTLVLHSYGRWNNAFKLAGEVDVFEGLASAKQNYVIDDDRVSIRGFSMGGAGVWHLAVHYPDQWFAANPGAGFSETPRFLKVFQGEGLKPNWWEERLWLDYDCDKWALNLRNLPTVAYSGELDSQKQAADVMAEAMLKDNQTLTHVIGPKTKHAYEPEAKKEVDSRMAAIDRAGRNRKAKQLTFGTYTLRYNKSAHVTIDEIASHFDGAKLASIHTIMGETEIDVVAKNITAFSLVLPPGSLLPIKGEERVIVSINNKDYLQTMVQSDHSLSQSFHLGADGKWVAGKRPSDGLRKKHGLQGPIDDAFMDSFLMVRPSGTASHEAVQKWTVSECDRAIEHWRRHFRGDARVKLDTEVTADDIKNHNLILWGDPASNAVLQKIAAKLPIAWGNEKIAVEKHGDFASDKHAVIAIYPNPLNPEKYVVLNSGFTFRDYAHLNNARQIPVLPDWAIVDLTTPPGNVWPGKIVAADFFDEQWKLKKTQ